MKGLRGLLAAAGLGFGLYGLWLMRGFTFDQLLSMVIWLVSVVVLHDFVLAPLTVGLGLAASRLLPGHFRSSSATAFLVWATLTVTAIAILSGQGGKPDNPTVLNRPYFWSWLVLTLVLAGIALVAALRRRRAEPLREPEPVDQPVA